MVTSDFCLVRSCSRQLFILHLCLSHVVVTRIKVFLLEDKIHIDLKAWISHFARQLYVNSDKKKKNLTKTVKHTFKL